MRVEVERGRECMQELKTNFVTLQNAAGGSGYIGKGVEERGGKSNSNFLPKRPPIGYRIWGEKEGAAVRNQLK